MNAPVRRITIECRNCLQEYEDWYRPPVNIALDPADDTPPERARRSTCPSCGSTIEHGLMLVREEDGVWIVEAKGEAVGHVGGCRFFRAGRRLGRRLPLP